jgi:hypothetical protein
MDTTLSAKEVRSLFMQCLYTEEETGELKKGEVPEGCVKGEGIQTRARFHPERLAEAKPAIRDMLNALPDNFHKTKGSGWSFLQMCMDKGGRQWGEHPNMDELLCLGIAAGMASYCMPRESWGMFPGGMPYIVFDTEETND